MDRFERHMKFFNGNSADIEKFRTSRVLIVGVGGLGSFVSEFLIRMGIRNIGLVDFDEVDITNLNRQILYTEADVGMKKVHCAKERLLKIDSNVSIEVHECCIGQNIERDHLLARNYDLIVDCTDNLSARKSVSNVCKELKKKVIFGAVQETEGIIATLDSQNSDSYEKLFGEYSEEKAKSNSILIPIVAIVAAIQSMEVFKSILGWDGNLSKELLYFGLQDYNIMHIGR